MSDERTILDYPEDISGAISDIRLFTQDMTADANRPPFPHDFRENLLDSCMMLIYSYIYHNAKGGSFHMGSQRTIITISEKDKGWLESFSKARGISMAEAIRQGIAQLKEKEAKNIYRTLVEETSGMWKKGDGLAYQEKLRSEWR